MNGDKKTNGFLLFDIHDSMYFIGLNGEFTEFTEFEMRKRKYMHKIYTLWVKIVKSKQYGSLHCFHVLPSEYNIHVGFKNGFT